MIQDIMAVFDDMYAKHGENLVIDNYILAPGTYVILSVTEGIKQLYEVDRNTLPTEDLYSYFTVRDYYSKLLDMNKPIDGKKIIHSNQIYGFFVKKENLQNGKLTQEIIADYYTTLKNPRIKYKDKKKKLAMYEDVELLYGAIDEDEVQQIQQCVISHLPSIQLQMKDDKNYLKVFIEKDKEAFIKESKKYIVPNIFNSTDFNIVIDGQVYGLPNDNMGLNAKKPFLENKQQKTTVPTLMTVENVLKQKVLFDYLMNFAAQGRRYVFIEQSDTQPIRVLKNDETLETAFMGYFMYIQKGKELEIHDFDVIQSYTPKVNFEFVNVLNITLSQFDVDIEFKNYKNRKDIQKMVNQLYFKKFLMTNYFTDVKDIQLRESYLKEMLVLSRKAWFDWFYKGNDQLIRIILDRVSLSIMKGTLLHDSVYKARHQYNLYHSLKAYFVKGDVNMADVLSSIKEQLRLKILQEETAMLENDTQYYFAVGQATAYLLSQSKSNTKTDALLNPIINCNNVKKLNQSLINIYKKYNHAIKGSKKFRHLLAMIQSYEPDSSKVDTNIIIAGYLHSNLIYEKQHDEQKDTKTLEGNE